MNSGNCKHCFIEFSSPFKQTKYCSKVCKQNALNVSRRHADPKKRVATEEEMNAPNWTCRTCGESKPQAGFRSIGRFSKSGYAQPCKTCYNAKMRAYQKINPNKEAYLAKQRLNSKISLDALKIEAQKSYGGKCVCCGETEPKFLSMDHIHNDGKEDRIKHGSGVVFLRRLKKLGFPKDRYQLLCFNCNMAKGFFGSCPHQAN